MIKYMYPMEWIFGHKSNTKYFFKRKVWNVVVSHGDTGHGDCDESLSSEMLIVGSLVLMMLVVLEVLVVTRLEGLQHGRGRRWNHPGGEKLGRWRWRNHPGWVWAGVWSYGYERLKTAVLSFRVEVIGWHSVKVAVLVTWDCKIVKQNYRIWTDQYCLWPTTTG